MTFTSVFAHNNFSDTGRTSQVPRVPHRMFAVDDTTGKEQSFLEAREAPPLLYQQGVLFLLASFIDGFRD